MGSKLTRTTATCAGAGCGAGLAGSGGLPAKFVCAEAYDRYCLPPGLMYTCRVRKPFDRD